MLPQCPSSSQGQSYPSRCLGYISELPARGGAVLCAQAIHVILVRLWLLPVSRSIGLPLLCSFSFLRVLLFILDVHSGACFYPSKVKYLWISMVVHGQRGMGQRTGDPGPSGGWHTRTEHHWEMEGLADGCELKSSVGLHCCVWLRGALFFETIQPQPSRRPVVQTRALTWSCTQLRLAPVWQPWDLLCPVDICDISHIHPFLCLAVSEPHYTRARRQRFRQMAREASF